MNITSLLPTFSGSAASAQRPAAVKNGSSPPASVSSPAATPSNSTTTALRQIVTQYDVTDISPDQFSQMIQQLSAAKAISPKEAQELSSVRGDLDAAGIGADQSVNLVDFYQQKIQAAQHEQGDLPNPDVQQQQMAPLAQRLGWLEKFATLHAHPEAASISALC